MGVCASSHITRRGGGMNWPSTAKVIHLDGKLQEFRQPIKASHIVSHNPNCFLCNSEAMYLNSCAPHVPGDEELQLGQIYFLMPLSKSHKPLSLQYLCTLAIKASTALGNNTKKSPILLDKNSVRPHRLCEIPSVDFEVVGLNTQVARA